MEDVKLCKECAHFVDELVPPWHVADLANARPAMCLANQDPVYGGARYTCRESREYGPCGEDGKFFEARPPRRGGGDDIKPRKKLAQKLLGIFCK